MSFCITLIAMAGFFLSTATYAQTCNSAIPATTPTSRFTDNSDGTVTDIKTGLMWKQCSEGQITDGASGCSSTAAIFTWQQALQRAQQVNADSAGEQLGYADWRMPNIKELKSLVEQACYLPAINEELFPSTPSSSFWSASPFAGDPSYALYGLFDFGGDGRHLKSDTRFVRLVRGGQSFDPWIQQAKLLASDGMESDIFGISVALSQDTAIIGASGDKSLGSNSGSAYVFVRDLSTDAWIQQAKLLASDGAAGDYFGTSIAFSSDTALIGAVYDDDLGAGSGSAYVFVRNPATGIWSQQAKLLAGDGTARDYFGFSVALSGNTALIGAGGDDDLGLGSGSTYVFVRDPSSGTWIQHTKLLASDGVAGDSFGTAIALSNDTALIGARGNEAGIGSAYVFVRDPSSGTWTQQTKLLASDGVAGDSFGTAIALSGNTALIGADGDDDLSSDSGSAYVFIRDPSSSTWTQQTKLLASDGVAGDSFGTGLALSGDTALIGGWEGFKNNSSGSAYVFVRDSATGAWLEHAKLLSGSSGVFGTAIALSGDTAFIGAVLDDNSSGSIYVFQRNAAIFFTLIPIRITNAAGLYIRQGPGTETPIITEISYGQQFVAFDNNEQGSDTWYKIHLPCGNGNPCSGWVAGTVSGTTYSIEEPTATQVEVTGTGTDGLNIRAYSNGSVIDSAWDDQRFVTLGTQPSGSGCYSNWYEIYLPLISGAATGWVCGDYLQLSATGGGLSDIQGRLTSAGSSPLTGVTLEHSGTASNTTTTLSDGTYSFSGLSAGSYTPLCQDSCRL